MPKIKNKRVHANLTQEINEIEQDLDKFFARRMFIWRWRTIFTAIFVGILNYFYPNLWWLWFIPLLSLVIMGVMYLLAKRDIAKVLEKLD